MITSSLPETNAALATMIREKLGVRGPDRLSVKIRRIGRTFPKAVRRSSNYLVEMEKLYENPKLRRQIDTGKVALAQDELKTYLDSIDPRDRRIGRILGIIAPLAFNLLLVFGAVVTWMVMTDRL